MQFNISSYNSTFNPVLLHKTLIFVKRISELSRWETGLIQAAHSTITNDEYKLYMRSDRLLFRSRGQIKRVC